MKAIILFAGMAMALLSSYGSTNNNKFNTLNEQASKEYLEPLRPGYKGKNPYWNINAKRFLYAPAFNFREAKGAKEYRFELKAKKGDGKWTFTANKPWNALVPIWNDVTVGDMKLTVLALDKNGEVIDTVGTRSFFRDFPFHGPYKDAVVPYRESALKAALYIHNLPYVQRFAESIIPDQKSYPHYACACKVIGSLISSECLLAQEIPSLKKEALAIALGAANFLVSESQPADAPLAYFPPTYYKGKLAQQEEHRGKTITVEAAKGVGPAFLDLFDLTADSSWFKRAIEIARTYKRLQAKDGSLPIKMVYLTGQPVNNAKAMLHPVLNLLYRLHKQYGIDEFEEMRAKGEKWMREVPLKTFDMTGQFEDVTVLIKPYENLTNCTASPYADYLLRKDHPTEEDISNARDLMRLSEDQFIHWKYAPGPDGICINCAPAVHEQYKYETPIDNSSCNVANALLSYYELTGDRLSFEKAKALIDNLTIAQHQNEGIIPTALVFKPKARTDTNLTLNCCIADIKILMRMHELTERMKAEGKFPLQ